MASVGDYIFLVIVLAIVGAIVYAVKGSSLNDSVQKQRDAMKAKGLHISSDGVSVKTNRVKQTREDEVNKAQAKFAKSGRIMAQHKDAFSYGGSSNKQK